MASQVLRLSTIFIMFGVCFAQVSDICVNCLCNAVSGCDRGQQCNNGVCGPFAITWDYWSDAGRHCINGVSADAPNAYSSCTTNYDCSVRTIQGYMRRYKRDCNGDGQYSCFDYMAIHGRGMNGCHEGLPTNYNAEFQRCAARASPQRGHGLRVLFTNKTQIINEVSYEMNYF